MFLRRLLWQKIRQKIIRKILLRTAAIPIIQQTQQTQPIQLTHQTALIKGLARLTESRKIIWDRLWACPFFQIVSVRVPFFA